MKCPYCRIDQDRVLDSRASDDGLSIRRRRECLGCKRRFTTYERPAESPLKIIKKGGGREPFDREKIRRGIQRACWKRPISDEQIETLVTHIEAELYDNFETEIETRYIGEVVLTNLKTLDQVAYVRFASVYRDFEDMADFVDELEPMLLESRRKLGQEA